MYCVKCKKKTSNAGTPAKVKTKNNRVMMKTKCGVCGTVKCQFIKDGGALFLPGS